MYISSYNLTQLLDFLPCVKVSRVCRDL